MEEIQLKPGIKDIRERKLVQKSDKIQAETKDSYIWMHDFAPQKDGLVFLQCKCFAVI